MGEGVGDLPDISQFSRGAVALVPGEVGGAGGRRAEPRTGLGGSPGIDAYAVTLDRPQILRGRRRVAGVGTQSAGEVWTETDVTGPGTGPPPQTPRAPPPPSQGRPLLSAPARRGVEEGPSPPGGSGTRS